MDYDGIENVIVDQDVNQSAAFQVDPIAAGRTVTVHGPLPGPKNNLTLTPIVTYTVGGADHTLDGYLGTLNIDDRALTGTLILDDSADPRAKAANSDMLDATIFTGYVVSGGSLTRTRTINYLPDSGRPSTVGTFKIQEPNNGIASVEVLAGGEYNGFDIYSLPSVAMTLVGGPGYDTFSRHLSPLGSTGSLTLIGNGGGDTFFYDDSGQHDTSDASGVSNHDLNYALTFTTMTSGTLHVADHNTGYHIDQNDFNANVPFDWTPFENVAFSGMGEVWIQGASGSLNSFLVRGSTAANLYLGTGSKADMVNVGAPISNLRRGSLSIIGTGPSDVYLGGGALDVPALTVQSDSVTLDDSLSKVAHHYVVDQGSFTRDAVRFSLAVRGLYVKGGQGNDVFDLKQAAIGQVPNASTWLEGGAGNDTFNLAHDVQEAGGSSAVRSLDGYSAPFLVVDGGTGNNSVVADDSGSNGIHNYSIQTGSLNYGDWGAGVTFLYRDNQRVLISENVARVSLLTAKSPLYTTTRINSLPASVTFSVTAPPSAYIYLGDPRSYVGPGHVAASSMDNVLGTVEVHSTGTGPLVSIDDRASTAGRRYTVASTATGGTISGFGTGRLALFGYKSANVQLLAGGGDDTFTILGRIPGLLIDGGNGSNTLDYSSYTVPVKVDLVNGTATDIDRGIAMISRVILPKH